MCGHRHLDWWVFCLRTGETAPSASWAVAAARRRLLVLSAVPALLVGFLPGLIWGAQNHWANVSYLLHSGGTLSAGRLLNIAVIAGFYTYCLAPRALGGVLATQPDVTPANPHLLTFVLSLPFSCLPPAWS